MNWLERPKNTELAQREKQKAIREIKCDEWGHFWREKQKTIEEKRFGEWGHLLREKKDCNKQKIVVSEDTLLGWKQFFGISEWRDSLKGKTKDYYLGQIKSPPCFLTLRPDYLKKHIKIGDH